MSGKPLLLLTKLTVSFAVPSASNTLLVLTKETILCFIVKSICWILVFLRYCINFFPPASTAEETRGFLVVVELWSGLTFSVNYYY